MKFNVTFDENVTRFVGQFEVQDDTFSVDVGVYDRDQYATYRGQTTVRPVWEDQILQTANKVLKENIVVQEIDATETSNASGGLTLAI